MAKFSVNKEKTVGYRSEAHLILSAECQLSMTVRNTKIELLDEADDVDDLANGSRHYCWFSIKWYDSYPDIQEIDKWLCELPDEQYGFIRIGEESEDIEYRGLPWDLGMYLQRTVSVE